MNLSHWLSQHMIAAEAYDADELVDHFLLEMERGLNGEASSLKMIPAYVGTEGQVPTHESVAVIDAGGTNVRICMAQFNPEGALQLTGFSKQPMPGRDREQTAAEFYTVLADALESLPEPFNSIGFCFSYPSIICSQFDGELLYWSKEIKIPELVGLQVGKGLLEALAARGMSGKKVVILNDTVATLLAGMAQGQGFNASSYIGFILGTGTNTAYVEHNNKIAKLAGDHGEGSQVINIESGGFSAFKRGPADIQLDEQSENPGGYLFEKAISGVYMGPLTLELLQRLAAEHALSPSGGTALVSMKELSTIHIDNLAANNGRDIGVLGSTAFTPSDREIMKTVFTAVVGRAARLTAINLTAAVMKSGAGQDPNRPICINIDGSTYYKTYQMAEKVRAELGPMLASRERYIRCIQIDEAPIAGAAIAGLTSF